MNSNPDVCFGDTYMDFDPKTWALQQLGLGYTKAITEHISTCDEKIQDPTSTSIYKSRKRNKRVCVVPLEITDEHSGRSIQCSGLNPSSQLGSYHLSRHPPPRCLRLLLTTRQLLTLPARSHSLIPSVYLYR